MLWFPLDQSSHKLYFHYMGMIRLIKFWLLFYEFTRVLILAVFVFLKGGNTANIPLMAFASPGVLFALMALFLWLDAVRYKAYLPLFTAGKCIGVFSLLGWLIFSKRFTMTGGFLGNIAVEWVFLSGDLFSIAAALLIAKDVKKLTETRSLEVG